MKKRWENKSQVQFEMKTIIWNYDKTNLDHLKNSAIPLKYIFFKNLGKSPKH
jgi:hypothetical protein